MNRRGFITLLAGSAATLAAGELILPTRKFFLPPRGGWPAMSYLTGLNTWHLQDYHGPIYYRKRVWYSKHCQELALDFTGDDGLPLNSAAHPQQELALSTDADLNEHSLERICEDAQQAIERGQPLTYKVTERACPTQIDRALFGQPDHALFKMLREFEQQMPSISALLPKVSV